MNADTGWVRSGEARRVLRVCSKTLSKWARDGHIQSLRMPGPGQRQHRLFHIASLHAVAVPKAEAPDTPDGRCDAIYARVSTRKQAADLDRQIEALPARYPGATVYRDICSGINFHRRGLQALLEQAMAGRREVVWPTPTHFLPCVHTLHIAHRDRLCRFAYDLVRFVLERCGVQIVLESSDVDPTPEGELADDILSIITVFGARLYGARSRGGGR